VVNKLAGTLTQKIPRKTYFAPEHNLLFGDEAFQLDKTQSPLNVKMKEHKSFEFAHQRNTIFALNITRPSLFKILDQGKKRKRRKILKPLTHCPLREREVDSSFDEDVEMSDEEKEEKEDIVEKEEEEYPPQKGAESGVNQENYDDLKYVYQNNEAMDVEKPFRTEKQPKKQKVPKTVYFSATNAETIHLGPVVKAKSKEVYKFNLAEVKKYLDSLDEYERTKLLNERSQEAEENKQCGCSIF